MGMLNGSLARNSRISIILNREAPLLPLYGPPDSPAFISVSYMCYGHNCMTHDDWSSLCWRYMSEVLFGAGDGGVVLERLEDSYLMEGTITHGPRSFGLLPVLSVSTVFHRILFPYISLSHSFTLISMMAEDLEMHWLGIPICLLLWIFVARE